MEEGTETIVESGVVAPDTRFYCRYVIGHEDKVFGREFLEFEIAEDGYLRYANESQYKHSQSIRKEVKLSAATLRVFKRLVEESEIMEQSDELWPEPSKDGYQKLEIEYNQKHISLVTSKLGSLISIAKEKDAHSLRIFYYFVQDLKPLIFSLISLHFKIKPI